MVGFRTQTGCADPTSRFLKHVLIADGAPLQILCRSDGRWFRFTRLRGARCEPPRTPWRHRCGQLIPYRSVNDLPLAELAIWLRVSLSCRVARSHQLPATLCSSGGNTLCLPANLEAGCYNKDAKLVGAEGDLRTNSGRRRAIERTRSNQLSKARVTSRPLEMLVRRPAAYPGSLAPESWNSYSGPRHGTYSASQELTRTAQIRLGLEKERHSMRFVRSQKMPQGYY